MEPKDIIKRLEYKYSEWIEELGENADRFLIGILANEISTQNHYIDYLEKRLKIATEYQRVA
jgi:hypothetical protein